MLVQSSRETFYRMIQMILFYFFLFHFQDIIHSVFVHSFTFFVFPSQIPPSSNFFPLYSLLFSLSTFPSPLSLSLFSLLHFFSLYIFSLLPLSSFPLHLKLFVVNLLPPIFFPSLSCFTLGRLQRPDIYYSRIPCLHL